MELLAVILIVVFLSALLLPALNDALRTARNAAVGAEINQLAQVLASFKARYGDYPPSRIYLSEGRESATERYEPLWPGQRQRRRHHLCTARATVDCGHEEVLSEGDSSTSAPRRATGTTSTVTGMGGQRLHDAVHPPGPRMPGVLPGRRSGVDRTSGYGMTGFGKDPDEPVHQQHFSVRTPGNPSRCTATTGRRRSSSSLPTGWCWTRGNLRNPGLSRLTGNPSAAQTRTVGTSRATPINFYAYFSSYGNGGYDPNDVNFVSENSTPSTWSARAGLSRDLP